MEGNIVHKYKEVILLMEIQEETVKRFCRCIKQYVDLTAEVEVVKLGSPAQPVRKFLKKWLRCDMQDSCGKKCNYFYALNLADCEAGNEEEVSNL